MYLLINTSNLRNLKIFFAAQFVKKKKKTLRREIQGIRLQLIKKTHLRR